MADTHQFFEGYLPRKIEKNPEMVDSVDAIIQFDIGGAGSWVVDLKNAPGSVREGTAADNDCVVTCAKADWEKLLDNPAAVAMKLFLTGRLKASNLALANRLQAILR